MFRTSAGRPWGGWVKEVLHLHGYGLFITCRELEMGPETPGTLLKSTCPALLLAKGKSISRAISRKGHHKKKKGT